MLIIERSFFNFAKLSNGRTANNYSAYLRHVQIFVNRWQTNKQKNRTCRLKIRPKCGNKKVFSLKLEMWNVVFNFKHIFPAFYAWPWLVVTTHLYDNWNPDNSNHQRYRTLKCTKGQLFTYKVSDCTLKRVYLF
jgi:hypothetical protein